MLTPLQKTKTVDPEKIYLEAIIEKHEIHQRYQQALLKAKKKEGCKKEDLSDLKVTISMVEEELIKAKQDLEAYEPCGAKVHIQSVNGFALEDMIARRQAGTEMPEIVRVCGEIVVAGVAGHEGIPDCTFVKEKLSEIVQNEYWRRDWIIPLANAIIAFNRLTDQKKRK